MFPKFFEPIVVFAVGAKTEVRTHAFCLETGAVVGQAHAFSTRAAGSLGGDRYEALTNFFRIGIGYFNFGS